MEEPRGILRCSVCDSTSDGEMNNTLKTSHLKEQNHIRWNNTHNGYLCSYCSTIIKKTVNYNLNKPKF